MSDDPKITPCLWFDTNAEEAAEFYISVFGAGAIVDVTRNGPDGPGPEGSVLAMTFEVAGQRFQAINGGPVFSFTEAISMSVACKDQAEVDHFWNAFLGGGGKESQCGWLKDRFGLSWQIVPEALPRLLKQGDKAQSARVMQAMMQMVKLDVAKLEAAYHGQ